MKHDADMRIIIDTMGGDNAPLAVLRGCIAAHARTPARLILVGDREKLHRAAGENDLDLSPFEIVHAPSVITMEDHPLTVIREKKDSSMIVGLNLLKEDRGDVFVSAGNTGALFAGATVIIKKAQGVSRAAIATVLPMNKPCLLLDSGANVSVTAEHLREFARMGSEYMRTMYGISSPAVGLLNNGTEAGKGTALQIEAGELLAACEDIRYVGNVEGSAVPFGACDVLVTDGFTGNVFLKTSEGIGKMILGSVKSAFTQSLLSKLSALLVKKQLAKMKKRYDPAEYGGAPILGIAKPVIKAHGSSDARAFMNAVFQGITYARKTLGDI